MEIRTDYRCSRDKFTIDQKVEYVYYSSILVSMPKYEAKPILTKLIISGEGNHTQPWVDLADILHKHGVDIIKRKHSAVYAKSVHLYDVLRDEEMSLLIDIVITNAIISNIDIKTKMSELEQEVKDHKKRRKC